MDLNEQYIQENALILLKGLWYSELPPIINFDDFSDCILNVLDDIENQNTECYNFDNEYFVTDFKNSANFMSNPGA